MAEGLVSCRPTFSRPLFVNLGMLTRQASWTISGFRPVIVLKLWKVIVEDSIQFASMTNGASALSGTKAMRVMWRL